MSLPTSAGSKKPSRSLAPSCSLTPPLPPQPRASPYPSLLILQMVVIKISGKMSSFQKKKNQSMTFPLINPFLLNDPSSLSQSSAGVGGEAAAEVLGCP